MPDPEVGCVVVVRKRKRRAKPDRHASTATGDDYETRTRPMDFRVDMSRRRFGSCRSSRLDPWHFGDAGYAHGE